MSAANVIWLERRKRPRRCCSCGTPLPRAAPEWHAYCWRCYEWRCLGFALNRFVRARP